MRGAGIWVCCDAWFLLLQLADDLPGVSLAVSLHAPNQELRQSIVPSAKAYPLHKLMATLDAYLDKQDQRSPKVHRSLPCVSVTP